MLSAEDESEYIYRNFLKNSNENFDEWEWDGQMLSIYFENTTIEIYTRNDLKQFLPNL